MADANTANARRLPFASRCRHTGLLHAQNKLILNNTQGICTTKARSAFAACGGRAPSPAGLSTYTPSAAISWRRPRWETP